jgi:RNA polymerase sigma-70 factor, ECF subfamily
MREAVMSFSILSLKEVSGSMFSTRYATIDLKNLLKVLEMPEKIEISENLLEWLKRSREGDHEAMEMIYLHFKSSLFGLAYRYTYNAAAAEDLTQDIFVKVFINLSLLDNDKAFIGWIYRVAVNTCLSYLRSNRKVFKRSVPFDDLAGVLNDKDALADEKMMSHSLEEAISKLPTKLKSVFLLHDVQGFKHKEIATILSCSTGTSKSQLFKARNKLKKYLVNKELI